MSVAAFFDMDHTVLRVETSTSWARFLRQRGELSTPLLARSIYWSLLYKLAVLDMDAVFTRLSAELRGSPVQEMFEKSQLFFEEIISQQIAPLARTRVREHQTQGHLIVLATGSTDYAALPVARELAIEHVLASELAIDEETGLFTGKPKQFGFGQHKVQLAEQWAQEHGVDLQASYFYSDSFNDLPLLERVGTAIAVNPDARLRRHARLRGWRIEQWM